MSNTPSWVKEVIDGVPKGMRHDTAIRLVGRWYGNGMHRIEVSYTLVAWNQLNSPPLPEQELKSIFQSTKKWERLRWTPPMSDEEAREIVREVRNGYR
ncbi:primase C-terminal domain-containing protein [Chloroflexota bacterium]